MSKMLAIAKACIQGSQQQWTGRSVLLPVGSTEGVDNLLDLGTHLVFLLPQLHIPFMLLFNHSVVSNSVTPWTAACQASLSILYHLQELAQIHIH